MIYVNSEVLRDRWRDIKTEIHSKWDEVSNDELEQARTDVSAIADLLHQKYGYAQEEATEYLADIVSRYESESESESKLDPESLI